MKNGLFDQHVHTWHSWDSKAEPRVCALRAIDAGLAGITFTEHFDTHPRDRKYCHYDDEAYSQSVAALREEFGDRLRIGKGIEVCYQPAYMDMILNELDQHEFDLVILSAHYFGAAPLHERESWNDVTCAEGTRRYLETVRDAALCAQRMTASRGRVFDVLGHLDLAKRYTQRFFDTYDVSEFGGLIDEILNACLRADLVPEINTSTLRQGLAETMPNVDTIRRYAALGGTGMALGSDAHRPDDVGADLTVAARQLRSAGLNHLVVFDRRHRVDVPLPRT